jgi:phospholipid-binding lipoprotein MlaA
MDTQTATRGALPRTRRRPTRFLGVFFFVVAALSLVGPGPAAASDNDPWMKMNRGIFRFNDALDRYAFEPVAKGYDYVVPDRVQNWVDNFFVNLRFPVVFANCLLQAKPAEAITSLSRFLLNTAGGLGGFGDPATALGMPKPNEDFGQTLGHWGVGTGPYLVLPFLGPSDVRDTVGLGADAVSQPLPWLVEWEITAGLGTLNAVNTRSLFLVTVRDLRASSVDFYAAVRDAYLQRRLSLVEDRLGATKETEHSASEEDLYFPDTTEQ